MAEELYEFQWDVNETGYQWKKSKKALSDKRSNTSQTFLTDNVPLGTKYDISRYLPLKHETALFRIFAETTRTKEGILQFANQYGLLGCKGGGLIPVKPLGKGKQALGLGEPFGDWYQEISAMRQAVSMWHLAEAGDEEELSKYIEWIDPKQVICKISPCFKPDEKKSAHFCEGIFVIAVETDEGAGIRQDLLNRFKFGDVIYPARYYIQEVVNKHLKDCVSPRLLWGEKWDRLGLYFVPSSLIGALWLQFAQAIDGNKKFRRCQVCRKPYEISPETARTSKLFCSNACRSKNYRERMDKAREMNEAGKSLKIIARELETEETKVRNWIEGETRDVNKRERKQKSLKLQ